MTNVVAMPDPSQVDVEAGLWISKIDRGLSRAEEVEFRAWLASSQQHRDVFKSLAHLWDDMEDLSRLSDLFPDEDASAPKQFGSPWLVAASLVLAVCVVGLFSIFSATGSGLEKTYETSVGEHSSVSLPDGSELVLNTNSLVTVAYNERHRLITLERGEIHIDVAHDTDRPLSVKAADKVIQAVGTAFNVELMTNQQLELIVTDGKVRVGDRSQFEDMLAGVAKRKPLSVGNEKSQSRVRLSAQSMSVSKGEKVILGGIPAVAVKQQEVPVELLPIKVATDEIEATLSWRQGSLAFNGETLEEAITEISRYTSTQFDLEGEEIKRVRIAGLFKAGDVNGLLLALEDTFHISSKKTAEERFTLYSEEPAEAESVIKLHK